MCVCSVRNVPAISSKSWPGAGRMASRTAAYSSLCIEKPIGMPSHSTATALAATLGGWACTAGAAGTQQSSTGPALVQSHNPVMTLQETRRKCPNSREIPKYAIKAQIREQCPKFGGESGNSPKVFRSLRKFQCFQVLRILRLPQPLVK